MSNDIHVGVVEPRPGVRLPIVDCKSWYATGTQFPVGNCRRDLDVAGCAECQHRESRNGNMFDPPVYGRTAPEPPSRKTVVPAVTSKPATAEPARMRGLGDLVAKATSAVGIKPCGSCKKRQEALNKLVPFEQRTTDGSQSVNP